MSGCFFLKHGVEMHVVADSVPCLLQYTLCLKKWDMHIVPHSSHKNQALIIRLGIVNRK